MAQVYEWMYEFGTLFYAEVHMKKGIWHSEDEEIPQNILSLGKHSHDKKGTFKRDL